MLRSLFHKYYVALHYRNTFFTLCPLQVTMTNSVLKNGSNMLFYTMKSRYGAIPRSTKYNRQRRDRIIEGKAYPTNENGQQEQVTGMVLNHDQLSIIRPLEYHSFLWGFLPAKEYKIENEHGEICGLIQEDDSLKSAFLRQYFYTHRSFTAWITDNYGRKLFRVSCILKGGSLQNGSEYHNE
jgi:hypothetical protein